MPAVGERYLTKREFETYVRQINKSLSSLRITQPGSAGGGAASHFTGLSDVPGSYAGHAGKVTVVNASENALTFTNSPTFATVTSSGATAGVRTSALLINSQAAADGVGARVSFYNIADFLGGIELKFSGGVTDTYKVMNLYAGGDSGTPKVTILGSGNVLIGGTAISAFGEKLAVKGGGLRLSAAATDHAFELGTYNDGSTIWGLIQVYKRDTSTTMPMWYEASKHYFTGGNVGIGTATPGYLLTLAGPSAICINHQNHGLSRAFGWWNENTAYATLDLMASNGADDILDTRVAYFTAAGDFAVMGLKSAKSHPTNYKPVYVDIDTGELYRIA